jgi:hypothetical protein
MSTGIREHWRRAGHSTSALVAAGIVCLVVSPVHANSQWHESNGTRHRTHGSSGQAQQWTAGNGNGWGNRHSPATFGATSGTSGKSSRPGRWGRGAATGNGPAGANATGPGWGASNGGTTGGATGGSTTPISTTTPSGTPASGGPGSETPTSGAPTNGTSASGVPPSSPGPSSNPTGSGEGSPPAWFSSAPDLNPGPPGAPTNIPDDLGDSGTPGGGSPGDPGALASSPPPQNPCPTPECLTSGPGDTGPPPPSSDPSPPFTASLDDPGPTQERVDQSPVPGAAVPLPASLALLLAGAATGALRVARRRRHTTAGSRADVCGREHACIPSGKFVD